MQLCSKIISTQHLASKDELDENHEEVEGDHGAECLEQIHIDLTSVY